MINQKKASALALAYVIILVLVVTGVAHLRRVNVESDDSARFVARERAFWYAESGINHALARTNSEDFNGWSGSNTTRAYKTDLSAGSYMVSLEGVGTPTVKALSTGYSQFKGGGIEQRSIETVFKPQSPWEFGAFGKYSLHLDSNALTDSYDSRDGPYDVDTAFQKGDVGTNGLLLGIDSNANINGDVSTGPEGEVIIKGKPTINGHVSHENDIYLPPVTIPEDAESAGSKGDFLQTEGAKTIPADKVLRYDSFTVTSNAELNIGDNTVIYVTGDFVLNSNSGIALDGSVKIYVDGNITISSNGIINSTTNTSDLMIFGSGPNAIAKQQININSNSDFYGVLYAPEADVTLNSNADTFGSIVGGTIDIDSNSRLHYDEALQDLLYNPGTFKIRYWNEI